jgi:hypothetical protein
MSIATKWIGLAETRGKIWTVLISVLFYFVIIVVTSYVMPSSFDWNESFYPASQELLHGRTPYSIPTFLSVPWTLIPLLPFALLPERVGSAALFVTSILIFLWVAYQLGTRGIWIVVFFFSPPLIHSLWLGNVDALSLMGFFLPPQIGLFFVLMKPQMGMIMAVFWLVEAWRKNGIRQVIKIFSPVTVALLLSLVIFGNWAATRGVNPINTFWNSSWWPWSIPFGLVLTAVSLRDRRRDLAMAASPFLSPYIAHGSWICVVAALLPKKLELLMAVIGMWIIFVIRALQM